MLVLFTVGVLWSAGRLADKVPRSVQLGLTAVVVAACLAGAGVVGVAAATRVDDPGAWIRDRWDDFAGGAARDDEGSRFTGSLSSGRYAEWKVAWAEFLAHPVVGIGSDNYAAAYLERREDNSREPRYPHSIELRMLSQLGVVGTALFAAFIAAAVWLALSRRRRLDAISGGAIGAAIMVFAYWVLYGSQDWFWEIPALAGPALGLLGLAGAAVITDEETVITDEDAGDEITEQEGEHDSTHDGSRCGRRGRARRRHRSRPPRSRGVLLRRRAGRLAAGSTLGVCTPRPRSQPQSAERGTVRAARFHGAPDRRLGSRAPGVRACPRPRADRIGMPTSSSRCSKGRSGTRPPPARTSLGRSPSTRTTRSPTRSAGFSTRGERSIRTSLTHASCGSSLPGFQGLYSSLPGFQRLYDRRTVRYAESADHPEGGRTPTCDFASPASS